MTYNPHLGYDPERLIGSHGDHLASGRVGTRRAICEHLRRKIKAKLAELGEEVEFLARMEQDEALAELEKRLADDELTGDAHGAGSIENYFCPTCDAVLVYERIGDDESMGYWEYRCPMHGEVETP